MFTIKSALDWKLGNDIPKKINSHKVYMTSTKEYMQQQEQQIKQLGDDMLRSMVKPEIRVNSKSPTILHHRRDTDSNISTLRSHHMPTKTVPEED